jgi:hypothetical protein
MFRADAVFGAERRSGALLSSSGAPLGTVIPECAWPHCRMPQTLNGMCVVHAAQIEADHDPHGEDFAWT